MSAELAPDEPCPSCGRLDPRAAVDALVTRTRARTQLLASIAGEGLATSQIADIVTGVRSVSDVLAERDHSITSAPREDTP